MDIAHEDASRGEDTCSVHAQDALAVARSGPADSAVCTSRPEHDAHRHGSAAHGDTCVVHVPEAELASTQIQVETLAPVSSSEGSVVEVSVLDPPRGSRMFMSAMAHSDRTMQVRLPAPQQAVLLSDAFLPTAELLEEPSLLSEASWEGGGPRPIAVVSSEAAVSIHGAGFGSACVSQASASGSSRHSDGMCLTSVCNAVSNTKFVSYNCATVNCHDVAAPGKGNAASRFGMRQARTSRWLEQGSRADGCPSKCRKSGRACTRSGDR